jgi:hypothetical protein
MTTNTNGIEENMTMNNGKDEIEFIIDLRSFFLSFLLRFILSS